MTETPERPADPAGSPEAPEPTLPGVPDPDPVERPEKVVQDPEDKPGPE